MSVLDNVELPTGWVRATLTELGVEAQPGFASGRHNRDGHGVLHLRPMNVTRAGVLDTSDGRYVVDESDRRVRSGDILFNNTNSPALVGKTALVRLRDPAAYSNHMTRLRTPTGISAEFLATQLHWLWMSGYFQSVLNNHVNQASVATKKLLETVVVVPPALEQRRIVEALEDRLSRLDAATNGIIRAGRRLKPLISSVLDRTVLGQTGSSQAAVVDDSRKLITGLSSKRFDYDTLPSLPRGWFWRRAADVCEFISSGSTPKAHLMHAGSGDIPFLKVYNITQDGRIDFTNKPTYVERETHEHQLRRSRVRPGDVLTNIVGPPLGKTAVVPEQHPEWNINQAIVAFRAGRETHPEWLALTLRSPFILGMLQRTAKATAGQFNVALSTCRELPLPIPPMADQIGLTSEAAALLDTSDRLASQITAITAHGQRLRQAILRDAFSGKLVSQAPSDSPAYVLLEQIRAEREARGRAKTKRTARLPRKQAETAAAPPAPPASTTPAPTTAVQQELPL